MQPLIMLVALPLLLFIPGFFTLRCVFLAISRQHHADGADEGANRNSTRPKPVDLIETIGLSVSASFLVSSVVAFILVFVGVFSLWLVLVVVAVYTALVLLATRNTYRRPASLTPRFTRSEVWVALGAMVVVCLALALYSRYSETVLLIRDPATHVNTAVHIAESGGSLIHDPLYYSLEDNLQTGLVYERPVDSQRQRSGGYQVEYRLKGFPRDETLGRTTPQFFNLFPAWQAVGHGLIGMNGVFLVAPLFGALSVLLIFLVGRRLFGSVAGIAAAILLLVNLAHFWYARTPASEVMFQVTFLTAVLFWLLFSSTRHRLLGVFAGVGFGALTLIRIDSTLVLAGIAVIFLYLVATRGTERRDLFFLLPFIMVAALGLVDALYSSRPYVSLIYRISGRTTEVLGALVVVGATVALIAVLPKVGVSSLLKRFVASHALGLRAALALALIGLATFAYFVRPIIHETYGVDPGGATIPRYVEESFVRLGWYLSPLGLALATIGGAFAVLRCTNRGLALFLVASLLVTTYYLFDPRIAPDHFWAVRRFVPVTIPMSLLFIGLLVQVLGWRNAEAWSPSAGPRMPFAGLQGIPRLRRLLSGVRAPVGWLQGLRWLGGLVDGRVVAVGLLAVLVGLSVHQIWGFVAYRD